MILHILTLRFWVTQGVNIFKEVTLPVMCPLHMVHLFHLCLVEGPNLLHLATPLLTMQEQEPPSVPHLCQLRRVSCHHTKCHTIDSFSLVALLQEVKVTLVHCPLVQGLLLLTVLLLDHPLHLDLCWREHSQPSRNLERKVLFPLSQGSILLKPIILVNILNTYILIPIISLIGLT